MTGEPAAAQRGDLAQRSRRWIGFFLYLALLPVLLFATAGTIAWWQGWVWLIVTLVVGLGSRLLVARRHPDLLQERAAAREHANTAEGDLGLVAIIGIYGPIALLVAAGLDQRYGWTDRLVAWQDHWSFLGFGLVLVGSVLGTVAMLENRNFSAVVRIQDDRGHTVCSTGPYAWVRHPGYVGALLSMTAAPVALASLAGYGPVVVVAAAIVLRTAREDRFLHENLDGYADYAAQVRSRLVPGLW